MRISIYVGLLVLITLFCCSCVTDTDMWEHYDRYSIRNGTDDALVITGMAAESTVFRDTLEPLDERILKTTRVGGLKTKDFPGDLPVLKCDTIYLFDKDSLLYSWRGYSISPPGLEINYKKVGEVVDTTLYLWVIK